MVTNVTPAYSFEFFSTFTVLSWFCLDTRTRSWHSLVCVLLNYVSKIIDKSTSEHLFVWKGWKLQIYQPCISCYIYLASWEHRLQMMESARRNDLLYWRKYLINNSLPLNFIQTRTFKLLINWKRKNIPWFIFIAKKFVYYNKERLEENWDNYIQLYN